jgi:hypothetical protein
MVKLILPGNLQKKLKFVHLCNLFITLLNKHLFPNLWIIYRPSLSPVYIKDQLDWTVVGLSEQ